MAGKWLSRLVTFAVWTLVAMSVAWWSLKFVGAQGPTLIATTPSAPAVGSEQADLTKVFGSSNSSSTALAAIPAAINPATRFSLIGVVANRASSGVALISVDGKAARPYRVGSPIEDTYELKSVAARSAVVQEAKAAGATFTIELKPEAGLAQVPLISSPPPTVGVPMFLPILSPPPASVTGPGATAPLRPAQ